MARIWQTGWELNSTTTDMEFQALSGTVSISSTTVRSGTYAGRANPTAGTGFFRQIVASSNQSRIGYLRVYVRIATLPASVIQYIRFSDSSNNRTTSINLNSDGTLTLANSGGTTIGSPSAILSLNTWYMVELKCDATTATGTLEAKLDGVSFASGNNDVRGAWDRILVGAISGATSPDLFFDDLALNDDTGGNQNGYPGSGKIIHLTPNAAGDSNTFGTQTGGTAGAANNYTRVDEVPPNDATDFNGSSTLNQEDMFNMSASGIGASDTVNVVCVGFRHRNSTADATAGIKVQIKKTASGTTTQSAEIKPNSTTWKTNAIATPYMYPITLYADPDASAWTQSTLDSMQTGYKLVTAPGTAGRRIDVSAVWACVDYTPSTTSIKTVNGLARASVKTVNGLASASLKTINGLS